VKFSPFTFLFIYLWYI